MRTTFSLPRLRNIVGASLVGSFFAGLAFFAGLGGATAAPETTCTLTQPATAVEAGLHVVTFAADGNCGGVSVDLIEVGISGERVLASDALDGDNAAEFSFGAVPAGSTYEFRVAGKTDTTAEPVTVATFAG